MQHRKAAWFLVVTGAPGFIVGTFGLYALWLGAGAWKQGQLLYAGGFFGVSALCLAAFAGVLKWGQTMRKRWTSATPWLSRPDWAKGEIPAQENASSGIGLGLFGGSATIAAAYLFFSAEAAYLDWRIKWFVLAFGVAFISAAVLAQLFRRKFDSSFFELQSVPGVIGGSLEGNIRIGATLPEPSLFQIQLQCLKLQSRSGQESCTTGTVIWESDWISTPGKSDAGTCVVPVHIAIPRGYPEAEPEVVPNRVLWQLNAKAVLPGHNYSATFEVPVFTVAPLDPGRRRE